MATLIRRYAWVGAVVIGLVLVGAGAFFVVAAQDAKAKVKAGLVEEQITTSKDASIPGVLVQDAKTAETQADAIKGHTLGRWGPYTQMAREDPNRATYINGVSLRTALMLSVTAFGLADLATGVGAIIIVIGAGTVALAAPVLFSIRIPAAAKQPRPAVVPTS